MAKQNRSYFFSSPTGIIGRLFRTGNIPNETNYRHLLDSVIMFNEVSDTSKETLPGHVKKETDLRAINRSLPHADNYSRHIMAHQLPSLYAELQPFQTAEAALVGRGFTITPVNSQISFINKRDYVLENTLEIISSDNTVAVSEAVSGIIDLTAGTGLNVFQVMADAGDASPGYLDSKVGNSLEVTAGDVMEVVTDDTNSIHLCIGASGLYADLQINDTNTISHSITASGLESSLNYDALVFGENATGLYILPLGITASLIANNTIVLGKLNSNIFGDGLTVGGTVDVDVKNSIELDGASPNKQLQLVNDVLNPGTDKFYGTNNTGMKGYHDIINYLTGWKYESYTHTATADLDSGTGVCLTSGGASPQTEGIEDSGAVWIIDEFVGKVIILIYLGKKFARIITSNTATNIYFDDNILTTELPLSSTVTYQILEPYEITSDNAQILACYTTINDAAVILPNISSLNDRKPIKIYIENGDYDVYIVGQNHLITSASYYKHYALEHKNELIGLMPHDVSTEHFDVVEEVLIKEFLSAYWAEDYTLDRNTSPQKITGSTPPCLLIDNKRRMTEYIDFGFYVFESNSLLEKEIYLNANIIIEKSGDVGKGEVSIQFYKNGIALNRSVTTRFGSSNGTTTLVLNDLTDIDFTDIIDIYITADNDISTFKVLTGSSLIFKE